MLKHPRDRHDAEFQYLVDRIYASMTSRPARAAGTSGGLAEHLPRVSTNRMAGLMEALVSPVYGGRAELSRVAGDLKLDVRELFRVADALEILGFAEVTDGSIHLTAAGRLSSTVIRRPARPFSPSI